MIGKPSSPVRREAERKRTRAPRGHLAARPTHPAWLSGYRRLTIRYERHSHLFAAFLALAAAITCYKKLAKLAT